LLPELAAASAEQIAGAMAQALANLELPETPAGARQQRWATPNHVELELPTMRLRRFGAERQPRPVLICAPYSLHGATIADFARGHSLVSTLLAGGLGPVYVTQWRSATPTMRFVSIDNLLADLNVAADALDAPVDMIGICQGGWLAAVFAARFPGKVRKLVIAGAPIDIGAGHSTLSRIARATPWPVFEGLVTLGRGLSSGQRALALWDQRSLSADIIRSNLQLDDISSKAYLRKLADRFRSWYAVTVDLPGAYYLQVVEWLYRQNRLANGHFIALGRRIDLSRLTVPTFLLAARHDQTVAPEQLFALRRLVGTYRDKTEQLLVDGPHLSLFMGARTLREVWPRITAWLIGKSGPRARRRRADPSRACSATG
jgi:poly(3-hydroxyalkanoate) synthetase